MAETLGPPTVRLRPVSDTEYAQFAQEQVVEYAREKAQAGDWAGSEALDRSRKEHAELLADRLRPIGHRIFSITDPDGEPLGWVWEGPTPRPERVEGHRWLYQITVDPRFRRRGYGRAALAALEARLAREGVSSLELHVFRWNERAIALYRSAGYLPVYEGTTDLNLVKRLEGA